MDARESGQMSLLTIGYYVVTTLFATVVGFFLNAIGNLRQFLLH